MLGYVHFIYAELKTAGSEENGVQETECEMEISPNGAKQWIPTANPEETPYTGQKFKTVDEGIEFYKAYAKAVGFDVCHGTMRKTRGGEVAIKYMVCSREGFKPAAKEKNSQKGVCTETKKRRRVSKRVGCKARIVLTRTPNGEYKIHGVEVQHIMTKVGDKARSVLARDKEFRKALNSVVWDETLSVEEFEDRWLKLMEDYNLVKDRCAIEEQRYKQHKLNAECEGSFPETKTPLHMEQQAATLYTINMFYEFQTEIWEGSFTCHVIHKKDSIDARTYTVQEKGGKAFDVTMHTNGEKIECTCKKFIRVGILCRHALLVFNSEGVEEIPGQYIVPRWTRDAWVRPMHNIW
nr:protein FAR1-RELATED SEQUENCE 5-like [Ipomoea batatas]